MTTSKREEITKATQDRHPRLYSNLEQLLDQRQKLATRILQPDSLYSEQERLNVIALFDEVQGLIKKYLGL